MLNRFRLASNANLNFNHVYGFFFFFFIILQACDVKNNIVNRLSILYYCLLPAFMPERSFLFLLLITSLFRDLFSRWYAISLFIFFIHPFMFRFKVEYFNKTIYTISYIYTRNTNMECIRCGIFLLLSNENTCLSFIAMFCPGQKGYLLLAHIFHPTAPRSLWIVAVQVFENGEIADGDRWRHIGFSLGSGGDTHKTWNYYKWSYVYVHVMKSGWPWKRKSIESENKRLWKRNITHQASIDNRGVSFQREHGK